VTHTSRTADARAAVFDGALDAIVIIDHEGRIVAFNAAAERTFGVPRAVASGAMLADLIIPPRFRQAHLDGLRRYLSTGESLVIGRRVEFPALRADGTEFPVELAVVRVADAGPPLFIGYVRDMTENRRADVERAELLVREQEARLEAERANRAKDEFLAIVSHELRTPLNSILGWAMLLKSGGLSEEKRARALEVIERGARAQAQLVEDLIDLSRIVRGRLTLSCASTDAASATRAAIDMVQPSAQERGVSIVTDGLARPVMIWADRSRVQQIVWNLMSNAVKFTPRDGTVTVRLTRRDPTVEIVIEDTGIGIAPEFLPHLFERFRQGETVTRQHGGLGLGLAIVQHLVQSHGGSIRAESDGEGKGSRFTVLLPIEPPTSKGH
jgi:PAS domain S-box-containing protein